MKIKLIVTMLITAALSSISFGAQITISVDEAASMAVQNNFQMKVVRHESETSSAKQKQARSGYYPKLKLSGGISLLSDTPDIVSLANKSIDLNNALDGAYDMLKLSLGTDAQYYGNLAQSDPAKYGQTAQRFKSAYDSASTIADKIYQKEKYSDGLTYYGIKLSFEQPLYTGNRLSSINKQADLNILLSETNIKIAESNAVLDVKKSFYNARQASNILQTAKEAVLSLEHHVKEAESYYKAGLVPNIDVVRAETKLAEMKQKLLAAENGYALALSAFKFMIGDTSDNTYIFSDTEKYTYSGKTLEQLKDDAIKNRQELKQIDIKIELAKAALEISKSGVRPLVALTGEFEQKSNEMKWDPNWSIGLVGTINIFDGFMTKNQSAESSALISQASSAREMIINSIYLDVTQAYLSMKNSLESIAAAEKGVRQAEEMLKMADANYRAGLGSSLDKIDADTYLSQAKTALYNAQAQYSVSIAQLEKSTGKPQGGN